MSNFFSDILRNSIFGLCAGGFVLSLIGKDLFLALLFLWIGVTRFVEEA
jgi:hypothetical protein